MGYELIFSYNDKNEDGSYDLENLKELKRKVGEPFDEITLEEVAKNIIKQLSRRDVLVRGVKVFELVRKEISFRETKGGIVINNKKFLLDNETNIVVQEVPNHPAPARSGTAMVQTGTAVGGVSTFNGRPIKWVTLDPGENNLVNVKNSGLAFLPDKRYPVISEMPHPKKFGTMILNVLDENKREVSVIDDYFVNADQKLSQGFYSTADKELEPKLSYGDYEKDQVPDIRRK